jgi:hypothetical protein
MSEKRQSLTDLIGVRVPRSAASVLASDLSWNGV